MTDQEEEMDFVADCLAHLAVMPDSYRSQLSCLLLESQDDSAALESESSDFHSLCMDKYEEDLLDRNWRLNDSRGADMDEVVHFFHSFRHAVHLVGGSVDDVSLLHDLTGFLSKNCRFWMVFCQKAVRSYQETTKTSRVELRDLETDAANLG